MQAHIKDKNTLIINTMINDLEKEELLDFISGLKEVSFKELYDIEGNVSGIAFYKDKEPIEQSQLEISRGLSVIISFGLVDDIGNIVSYDDLTSLTLKISDTIIKNKEHFIYEDNTYKTTLSSEDTNIELGIYEGTISFTSEKYNDTINIQVKII